MPKPPCTTKQRLPRPALLAALVGMAAMRNSACATSSTWANLGGDWFGSLNWIGGVPNSGVDAVLPSSALVMTPDIGAGIAETPRLAIDNSGGGIYNLS